MTTEIETSLPLDTVLEVVRSFFFGENAIANAWIETESETHMTCCTFRGNLSVAWFIDPQAPGKTKVRVTTLREEGVVPRLIAHIALQSSLI